jgi:hypothetical protein
VGNERLLSEWAELVEFEFVLVMTMAETAGSFGER